MNYADKSVCVTGNLKDGPLEYRCYPVDEFNRGTWCVAINSVTFDSVEVISKTCVISCNFSTSQKRSKRGEILIYEQPLNSFHIKTSQAASRGIFRFCHYK